jgi:hypothetical protein
LPLLNSGRAELLDLPRLSAQLCGLERHTARSGRDSIDHAPGAHDDVANCVAGCLLLALGTAPALWRREALLVDEAAVPLPTHCDMVFAVLPAVAYFARSVVGHSLVLVDADVMPLTPALFHAVAARLVDFVKTCHARYGALLFTTSVLASELKRLGYNVADPVDEVAAEGDELLALAAAVHVGAGRVKITSTALAKAEQHPLAILDAAMHDEEDPLRQACLIGIALGLDEGRSLKARAA